MFSRTSIGIAAFMSLVAISASAQKRAVTIDDIMNLKAVGSPTVSPDGAHVLYTVRQWEPASEREIDRIESRTRIWRVPAAVGPARQITYGERGDTQPQWSPDGRYISFLSARGTGTGDDAPKAQIYVMRADGGEAWKLSDAKEAVSSYSWAPDSRAIAYVTVDPRPASRESDIKKRDDERVFEDDFRYSHLWTIDLDSRRATRVTDGTSWTVRGAPSWSPDGKRIAFSANATTMLRDGRSDVFIVTVANKQIEKISTSPGPDAQPEWSPNGAFIAWTSELLVGKPIADGTLPSSVSLSHLILYDVNNKTVKDAASRDFDIDAGTPRWTPDSRRVLFTAGSRAHTEVFSYDVQTAHYTQLTHDRTLQLGTQSKDGRVVALTLDSARCMSATAASRPSAN
jgi:Tol biopolymer transport system component